MIERYDAPGQSLPLFEAAGVEVEERPTPAKAKRQRKPRPPTPAERAATARVRGERRSACACTDTGRRRVGGPRDLSPPLVFGFPLSRNATLVREVVQQLPHFYASEWDRERARVCRNIERKLLRSGIPTDEAHWCANELVHAAFNIRADEAQKETMIR